MFPISPSITFIFELSFLFFLSRQVTRVISSSFHAITQSKKGLVITIAFLFLPGTILHELAHFFMAKILFVRTGAISLLPHLSGDSLRLGSVQIEQVDPVRKLLIGVAPILAGVGVLSAVYYFFLQQTTFLNWTILIPICTTFVIGNTMFSSRKDLEGTLGFLVIVTIIGGILLAANPFLNQSLIYFLTTTATPFFTILSLYLLPPIILDIAIILLAKALQTT